MIRVPNLWPTAAGLAVFALACGREQPREAAMQRDTSSSQMAESAPAAANRVDTTVLESQDTAAVVPSDTTAGQRQAPASAAQKPQPTPAPDTPPSPAPAPDTGRGRPNIDPRPATPPPKVPRPGGQDTVRQEPAPLRDAYHQAPRDTVSQAVYNGWKQFNLNCARCHGEDVLGTTIAPHLVESVKPSGPINTKELFLNVVCHGRLEKGMPAWCPLGLDTTKIEQIYAYVKGRSEGAIRPGRPAVRQ